MYKLGFIAVLSFSVGACVTDGQDGSIGPAGADGADGSDGTTGATGATGQPGPQFALPGVYTLANASGPNQVAAYLRGSNGNLSREGRFATGGAGLGAGLGSQGSLVFDAKSQRFFTVNAGDSTISMLAIDADGNLATLAMVPSGGTRPVSITVHGNMVYVVNQGDLAATAVNANISGFQIQGNRLVAIAGSTRALSATNDVHPTDIAFTPDGKFLAVVERFASKLDTFAVVNGVAQAGSFQASAGMQPFAFDWSPEGYLIVAEVGTGAAGASSASSYAISATGTLTPITSALPTLQSAACWLVTAGGYAYIANAASATLTGLNVSETGVLTLHDAGGITAMTGQGATDLAVSPDRGYLYSLSGNPRTIQAFEIHADGGLAGMVALPGVSATAVGLAAR
jgi:6-phosphogluconolactonase (cycloisomerase 2 family)